MKYMKYLCCLLLLLLIKEPAIKAQSFYEQVNATADTVTCAALEETDPVSVNALLVKDKTGDSAAVIVKAAIYQGWHIYAYVPSGSPYIVAEQILHGADGKQLEGEWVKSQPQPSETDRGVLVYEKKATFIYFLKKGESMEALEAGLFYQTCDVSQCMPPKEKTIKL